MMEEEQELVQGGQELGGQNRERGHGVETIERAKTHSL